jgi:hypothetical protein
MRAAIDLTGGYKSRKYHSCVRANRHDTTNKIDVKKLT